MSKKKFSIAPDLASGIRNTIQSASNNQGQLHYDIMSLDVIEPDPNNPRQLLITYNEMLSGINSSDPDYQVKIKELDALRELSESIKKIGVKSAIEVYKNDLKYRIITGERRYWASLLAGQKNIPARISPKPDEFTLRYTQWVENINRQDLSLWEKFNNLTSIADAFKSANQNEFTEQTLQKLLGVSTTQAYRYYTLLKADEKIIQLIKLKKLNNLKIIQELVSMKDKGSRNQIISWIESSKDEITSLANYREAAGKKVIKSKQQKGNNKYINLGKVNNTLVAKQLLEIILSSPKFENHRGGFKNIDWSSSKSITNAFKALFKTMEEKLIVEETA